MRNQGVGPHASRRGSVPRDAERAPCRPAPGVRRFVIGLGSRVFAPWGRYARWLHLQWPAGRVEKLPWTDEPGRASLAGVYVVGDLSGVPLLKMAADGGARAVRHLAGDPAFQRLRRAGGANRAAECVDVAVL